MLFSLAGVEPSPLLLRPFIGLLYHLWMTDNYDCGAVGGMNTLQGNVSTRRKHTPVPLWLRQIPQVTCLGLEPGPVRLEAG
jgi:hypothetical protein